MTGHLGSFARGALAAGERLRRISPEGAFDKLANCLRAAGPVGLLFGGHPSQTVLLHASVTAGQQCQAALPSLLFLVGQPSCQLPS